MPLLQYLLRPSAPFHFGAGRDDDPADLDDLPRSDSLASAVLSVWPQVAHDSTDSALTALAKDPPFAFSSAIPTIARNGRYEPLLFIPTGLIDSLANWDEADQPGDADASSTKALRKARFASVPALRALLQSDRPPPDAFLVTADGRILSPQPPPASGGPFQRRLEQEWEWSRHLWHRKKVARPRLVIDRDTGHAAVGILFRYAATVFRTDLRLLVVADLRPSCDRSTFETALRLLGHDGIGGGRSIGHGRFEIEKIVDAFDLNLGADDAEARMLLSLTHPTRTEVQSGLLTSPPAAYTLIARGGWAEVDGTGRFRRSAVRMLTEGSLVRNLGHPRCGDSVCVLPKSDNSSVPFDIYRSGCAVSIAIDLRLPT
jgi:CRISPR type III-A-associated RAMP protein Csm4